MQKWGKLVVSCFLVTIASSTAVAQDKNKQEAPCTQLQQAGVLSIAACSDPALKTTALEYARVYYALKAQDTADEYKTIEKQLARNDAVLKQTCSLPPTGPATAPPSNEDKACFINIRQQQTSALSHSLKEPYTQEVARPIALHVALQQKLIDDHYLRHYPSQAGGLYDKATRDAIKTWQSIYSDPQTGVITDDEVPHIQKEWGEVTFEDRRMSRRSDVSFISFPQPLPSNSKSPPLIRIFQIDMLGVERDYLEQITGPAKYIKGDPNDSATLTYMVDDCEVTAYVGGGTVVEGYSLHVTPHCTIPITGPGPHGSPPLTLADMTLTELKLAFPGNGLIIGLCFEGSCSSKEKASLGFSTWEPHANDYMTIAASASAADTNGDKVTAAAKQWLSAIPSQARRNYLRKGVVNCDNRYDTAGLHAMRDVPVQYFFFGNIAPDIDQAVTNSKNVICGDK